VSSGYVNILAAIVSVSFGIIWWALDRPVHWGDIYHHLFVAPLIFYLAITLLPVILINGTKIEKFCVVCLALVWVTLVVFDLKHERMNQRRWLQNHGVQF